MPPKNRFSKEQIVDAAFHIAKTEGIDSMTVRKVADQLGSSIAPIYVNFNDVEELKQAIIKRVVEISKHLLNEHNTGNPFADIGVASLLFAKEYPILFRDFVMKQNDYLPEYDLEMADILLAQMKKDPELEGFTDEELQMILFKMRTFQLGLSITVANELLPEKWDTEKMLEMLNSVAEDVVTSTRLRMQKEKKE
ncbi:TetR/AcrR family transcriptional regulator [Gracilibacillus alcaliphilus]|uniref:TetR/AcrR family transcriptional regulator n=1 Tax=Gracilibacillus alcaliphilus TaxID=1401441 RepID=UPI001958DFBF|nr:TetR/AcrR family transcriptional regulator [Gracilibacillus alcaliphilus]MBM7676760.1 AcrR family transcriptional regulator [Gracilibacillus alcaliphilus]